MRKLPLIIAATVIFVFAYAGMKSDSPHGAGFSYSCDLCHSPKGWKLDKDIYAFDHNKTALPLTGKHQALDCRQCHVSLVFSDAGSECSDCHTDIHYQTVGPDCGRCHTPESWIVNNINDIHRKSRFPLLGAHYTTDCSECHKSASLLRFEPLPTECYACHQNDYNATTSPNHVQAGYSTNCTECHRINSFSWTTTDVDHSFFPLTAGHAISDCFRCHTPGNYSNISRECVSCHLDTYNATTNPKHQDAKFPVTCEVCHTTNPGWKPATLNHDFFPLTSGHSQVECANCHINGNYTNTPTACVACHLEDYTNTTNPNHANANIPQTCADCHTTNPGWTPATFLTHDPLFPIYSGEHQNQWNKCQDCHPNPASYADFTCIDCHDHNKTDMDKEHEGLPGYAYNSPACFACHPTGSAAGAFNHNNTGFPLTGAHTSQPCGNCHVSGYTGTPKECFACHTQAFAQTVNPNHSALSIPNTCADCHTTNPGWKPATFPIHSNFYLLTGAHAAISNECARCHNGNYTTTPNTCAGCHIGNYNQTTNPPHASAQFPTDCETCHNQNNWVPSTFNHDGQYFPIYSGKHRGEWTLCSDCHTNPGNYAVFSCIDCHEHNKPDMDDEHSGVTGYAYNSLSCFQCHPDGSAAKLFKANDLRKQD